MDHGRRTTDVLLLKLLGANRAAKATGLDEQPGKVNYFRGPNPAKWRRGIATYARVKFEDVYPGIDLIYYGNQGRLEYDFVVKPGADPHDIALAVENGNLKVGKLKPKSVAIGDNGDLIIETVGGAVRLRRPVIYQETGAEASRAARNPELRSPDQADRKLQVSSGKSKAVQRRYRSGRYVLTAGNHIRFEVSGYDKSLPLIIDPVLSYSTYLGGSSGDTAYGIAVDATGNVYVAGSTSSPDFPTAGPEQTSSGGNTDVFVSKLDPAGASLLYSTYLGGNGSDQANALAVDGSGNVYLTGSTSSTDFPTSSALQSAPGGAGDAFVAKLDSTGSKLVYSTYLGGSGADFGRGIAVDSSGAALVTGSTDSTDFPTASPLQSANAGGTDAFAAKLNASGSSLVYSTYLGGTGADAGLAIALDSSGNAYLAGSTSSTDFPTTAGTLQGTPGANGDAFVSELNAAGSAFVYSTYLGGSGRDEGQGLALDGAGNAYVTGYTRSSDFTSLNPVEAAFPGGTCGTSACASAFVTELNSSGAAVYSTYLGGGGADFGQAIAVDGSNNAYVAGGTASTDFPSIYGSYAVTGKSGPSLPDAFVAKIAPVGGGSLSVLPLSLAFGDQATGIASAGQTVTLKNFGTTAVNLTSATADGDFTATNNCGGSVAPAGGNCTITVTFSPTTTGQETGTLTISDDASGGSQTVSLTGNGTTPAAAVTFSPNPLDFGNQTYNTTSAAQTLTLTNSGTATLNITNISTSGDFAQTNNCPAALASGASCPISVTFTPTSTGANSSTVQVTDDAANSPQSGTITGTGVAVFSLASDPPTLTVDQNAAAQTFKISATAPSSFTDSIALTCSANSPTTCSLSPTSITPGQTSTLTVSKFLGVTTPPVTVTVTGTSGTQTVTMTDTVNLTDFKVSLNPSITTVQAGETATYTLTLTPVNGFDQKVDLGCSWVPGRPQDTKCSVDPTSITLDGTNSATATLTVNTTSRSLLPPAPPPIIPWLPLAGMGALLAAFGMARSKRWKAHAFALPMAILLLLAAFTVACNTYYNPLVQGPAFGPGTPGGIYSVAVTGTSGKVVHSAITKIGVN